MGADPANIPTALIENVARGYCVLFLGADADYSTPDWAGPPTRAQLAAALADRYSWVAERTDLRLASEEYLSKDPPDEHGLRSFIRDQIQAAAAPGPLHALLLNLGFNAIVTNSYDELVERKMQEGRRRMLKVVGDAEIAYAGPGDEAILVYLAGCVSQPDSLVLTGDEQLAVENHLSEKLRAVRGWCSLRPLLFIGWNPDDDALRRLYYAATEALGKHKRRNYILWSTPSDRAVSSWKRSNVEIIRAEPLPFLRALDSAVQRKRLLDGLPGYQPGEIVGKLPYKFLNYFNPEDRDIFCGREVEGPLVFRMALSHRLLTLFGQSGVGKTSLLRAGVVPLLLAENYNYVYVRALGDPLQSIREAVCEAFNVEAGGETLLDFLCQALREEDPLVVILDQFEELYTRNLPTATRRMFWQQLSACLGMTSPEVRFVLALREDYLALLDEARKPLGEGQSAPVPDILRNSYRLAPLDTDTAYLAIVEPARRAHCYIDPMLADVLLGRADMPGEDGNAGRDDKDGRTWSLVQSDGQVPPPSLQIVMDRLYREALTRAGHKPPSSDPAGHQWRPPQMQLSLELYEELSGAGRILGEYVERALAEDVPKRGGDAIMARDMLKAMITAQATKAALDKNELAAELVQLSLEFDPQVDLAAMSATRAALVDARLVRSFEQGGRSLFEPAHDRMVDVIRTWISEEEMAAKAVRELLRREVDTWRRHDLLIAPEALRLIHEQRESLRKLSEKELELIFRSALKEGVEAPYWFMRARQAGVPVDAIARDGLRGNSHRTRAAAVKALAELGDVFVEDIIGRLADDYPQVRVAAIASLESLRPEGAWRTYLRYECYVPAGEFIMGDNEQESSYKDVKALAHPVYLDAFYIGKYPVTNAEYARFMADRGRRFAMRTGKEKHPVTNLSWYDAKEYADWAGMWLLTEAEWEKAASWEAGDSLTRRQADNAKHRKRKYPWGNRFVETKCNTYESRIDDTTPVGRYSPSSDSPCGAADMAGNVWEWCSSQYRPYPYKADDGRENLTEYVSRVQRGGAFNYEGLDARCAARNEFDPDHRNRNYGFRVGWRSPSPLNSENSRR